MPRAEPPIPVRVSTGDYSDHSHLVRAASLGHEFHEKLIGLKLGEHEFKWMP